MKRIIVEGIPKDVDENCTAEDVLKLLETEIDLPVAAVIDGKEVSLNEKIGEGKNISFLDRLHLPGYWVYLRSLSFLFIIAVKEIYPDAKVKIIHSMNNEIFGRILYNGEIDYKRIEKKMWDIVQADEYIEKVRVPKKLAQKIFDRQNMEDKNKLLSHAVDYEIISLYYSCGIYDYFYGPMIPSFGYIDKFKLESFEDGFLLLLPRVYNPEEEPTHWDIPKLRQVYNEMEIWAGILGIDSVGELNKRVELGKLQEIVLISEGLQEKKISDIADEIKDHIDRTKLILIAGPSSSGKTTFSNRLAIQLRVLGILPKAIAMDNYFKSRESLSKEGDEVMESVEAVDVEALQKDLLTLLAGGEINLRVFDFIEGKQKTTEERYSLKENSIIILEGIHGLNEVTTSMIPKDQKYKIYVSALTPLNLDDHNSIYVSDLRLMRRIVRDHNTRGHDAIATLKQWNHVRRGEEKNVFPYQEEADVMFNSSLIYEMIILKDYLLPLLEEIPVNHDTYLDAQRLIRLLGFFEAKQTDVIPKNSILREFIGGSCFDV